MKKACLDHPQMPIFFCWQLLPRLSLKVLGLTLTLLVSTTGFGRWQERIQDLIWTWIEPRLIFLGGRALEAANQRRVPPLRRVTDTPSFRRIAGRSHFLLWNYEEVASFFLFIHWCIASHLRTDLRSRSRVKGNILIMLWYERSKSLKCWKKSALTYYCLFRPILWDFN